MKFKDDELKLTPFYQFLSQEHDGLIDYGVSFGGELYILFEMDGKYLLKFSQNGEFKEFWFKNNFRIDIITPVSYPDSWLIACARSGYDDRTKSGEKNARILRTDGIFTEPFCLGDGIAKILVKDDRIHIGYYDEGVYGNYGWGQKYKSGYVAPFGVAGYVVTNLLGEKIYEYDGGVIDDCYAMNLHDGKAFLHYYSDFEFVSVSSDFCTQKYGLDFKGEGFAIDDRFVLFSKAFDGDKPYLYLFKFGDRLTPYKRLRLILDEKFRYFGRVSSGRFMLLCSENFIYRIDLKDLE